MKHIVENLLSEAVSALKQTEVLPADLQPLILVERSKDSVHGDFASNLAMMLAKHACKAPRELAKLLMEALPEHASIEKVEIAGPGFMNFFLRKEAVQAILPRILDEKERFGHSSAGSSQKILIEFVSCNPTGPLHVGHGRGAAYGASLANILEAAGFVVSREYYVNDAGRQMSILAASVWLRYLGLAGEPVIFPANGYRGDYVSDIANQVLKNHAGKYVHPWLDVSRDLPADEPEGGDKDVYIDALIERGKSLLGVDGFKFFLQVALTSVLDDIKDDLDAFGVHFDCWFSEQSLLDNDAIDKGIEALKAGGHTYIEKGALWFKATDFNDEKDRVLIKANGLTTYFASDVAYHWNKYERGYDRVINIFGADHHGYVSRLKAAVKALGHDEDALDILLVQFAVLYRGEERIQMSTRSGSFVTLRELREEVGADAARFFYVMRKSEQHMDFDLELAKSRSNENPVYYIQYAHARICSVFAQLKDRHLEFNPEAGLSAVSSLTAEHETALLTLLSRYPEVLAAAAEHCEPHQLAYYLRELANGLHSYYNAIQLLCEDETLRHARLCLLMAVRQVLWNGLHLLGVSAPESM